MSSYRFALGLSLVNVLMHNVIHGVNVLMHNVIFQEPLNSNDDVSDDEAGELFETDNVVVCQFDKVRLLPPRYGPECFTIGFLLTLPSI